MLPRNRVTGLVRTSPVRRHPGMVDEARKIPLSKHAGHVPRTTGEATRHTSKAYSTPAPGSCLWGMIALSILSERCRFAARASSGDWFGDLVGSTPRKSRPEPRGEAERLRSGGLPLHRAGVTSHIVSQIEGCQCHCTVQKGRVSRTPRQSPSGRGAEPTMRLCLRWEGRIHYRLAACM